MKENDLIITNRGDSYSVRVAGRANFEYATPLRELAKTTERFTEFRIDLADCVAMDSTFMGVLTMLALKAKSFQVKVELFNASEVLRKLLKDLGVAKLFVFKEGKSGAEAESGTAGKPTDMLTLAETVAEAHRSLAEAESTNAERFKDVIKFAESDVERLRGKQTPKP